MGCPGLIKAPRWRVTLQKEGQVMAGGAGRLLRGTFVDRLLQRARKAGPKDPEVVAIA